MKNRFKSYFKPTSEEFKEMWSNGIIAYDANVLLNFYRYSEKTNNLFFDIFNKAKEQIWIPNQSVFEYFNNRLSVIQEGLENYDKIKKELEKFCPILEEGLSEERKQPFIEDYEELLTVFKTAVKKIHSKLDESKTKYEELFVQEDRIMLLLADYLDGKVGAPYNEDELKEIYKTANERFENHIPPGYKDFNKKDNKYGDYVLWRQLIDYASANKKHIIFITDERKEDWWNIYKGKKFGPRPELRLEMYEIAEVQFYMYRPEKFVEYCVEYFGVKVDDESVREVVETRKKVKELEINRRKETVLKALNELAINNMTMNLPKSIKRPIVNDEVLRQFQEMANRISIPEETLRQLQQMQEMINQTHRSTRSLYELYNDEDGADDQIDEEISEDK